MLIMKTIEMIKIAEGPIFRVELFDEHGDLEELREGSKAVVMRLVDENPTVTFNLIMEGQD